MDESSVSDHSVTEGRSRNIRLIIAYDGSGFCGWQIQPTGRSVEGEIQTALRRVHRHPIRLIAAGRTDAKVHANGQVANFQSDCDSIPAPKFREALNRHLPADIRILKSEEVATEFHARRDAVRRIYHYLLLRQAIIPPRWRNYCSRYRSSLSVGALNRCAAPLIGTHDFTTFAALQHASQNAIRTIYSASFFFRNPFVVFRIVATSFLWKMVRTIVGTLTGLPNCQPEEIGALLRQQTPNPRCVTAPACGLYLEQVVYE